MLSEVYTPKGRFHSAGTDEDRSGFTFYSIRTAEELLLLCRILESISGFALHPEVTIPVRQTSILMHHNSFSRRVGLLLTFLPYPFPLILAQRSKLESKSNF